MQSDNFYRSLIVNMTNGYAYFRGLTDEHDNSTNFEFIDVNNAFLQIMGLNDLDIIGRPISNVLPEFIHNNQDWLCLCKKNAHSNTTIVSDMYCTIKTECYSISIYSHEQNYFSAIFTKVAKFACFKKSSECFFKAFSDLLWIFPQDGYVKKISPAWLKLFGWTEAEIISKPYIDFVHPDDREKTLIIINKLLRGGNFETFENRCNCKDGSYLWLSWECFNKLNGLRYAVARDITKQKQAEMWFQAMFNTNAMTIGLCNTQGQHLQVNNKWVELLGYSQQESLSLTDIDLIYADDHEKVNAAKEALLKGKSERIYLEVRVRRKDGTVFTAELFSSPIYDNNNKIAAIITYGNDVTQRKRHEQVLRLSYERRRRNELLNNLINLKDITVQTYHKQACKAGIDLELPLACYMIIIKEFQGKPFEYWHNNDVELQVVLDNIIDIITDETSAIAWECDSGIGVLYSIKPSIEDVKQHQINIAHKLIDKIYWYFPTIKLAIGINELKLAMTDIKLAYKQACEAVSIGQRLHPGKNIYHYLDIGVCQLFTSVTDTQIVDGFIERTIGKLLEQDRDKGTDYISTLEMIINDGNLKKTAEKLFVHHKTVMFRKKRIEEILGFLLDDFEYKLTLAIALKLYRLKTS